MEMGPMRNQNFDFLVTGQCLVVKIDKGQQKNKNRPHQPTIKLTGFLPINFLPLPAPPYPKAGQCHASSVLHTGVGGMSAHGCDDCFDPACPLHCHAVV